MHFQILGGRPFTARTCRQGFSADFLHWVRGGLRASDRGTATLDDVLPLLHPARHVVRAA